MNVATNLETTTLYFPRNPALSAEGQEITYGKFNEEANRVATALLHMGVKAGHHVGLCAPNSPEWLIFYFGVLKAGAVAVTLSSLLTPDELRLLLEHSQPKVLFSFDERLDDLGGLRGPQGIEKVICPHGDMTFQSLLDRGVPAFEAKDRDRTDTAAILYTGGTTGMPKGVMLTHENINAPAHNVAFVERSTEKDRALCFLPFNHVFGQVHIANSTILSGGCLEILPSFDMEKVLNLIERGRVTKFFSVPTVYGRLLTLDRLKDMMANVRYSFSSGAAIAVEIIRQWKERTGLNIHEGYGMTESASAVTYNHYFRHVAGSVGTTVPGVEFQIRDTSGNRLERGQEGEICIKGPNIMKGYLRNTEATESTFWDNGWFKSGDIGICDKEGYLYIVDRLKDLIITGGENVYPREVEEALYLNPDVEECSVIGLPDKEWGERVAAFIIPKPDKTIAPEKVKAFLKARLAPFKVPKEYIITVELPKSPAGKVLKREIRKEYLEKLSKVK